MSDRQGALSALTTNLFSAAGAETVEPATPTPPPNATPLKPELAEIPAASAGSAPAFDPDAPEETLADAVARAISGEPATEPATATAADAASQPPLTERELAMQAQLDTFLAEKAERELEDRYQQEDDHLDATWQAVWQRGYDRYAEIESQVRAKGKNDGLSDLEVEGLVRQQIDNPRAQLDERGNVLSGFMGRTQWEAVTTNKELNAHRSAVAQRYQPSQLDQLVTQYNLSPEHKTQLQQFAAQPDVMKQVAAILGTERARVATRDQAVVQTARENVAQHLAGGFAPGSPAAAAARRPHSVTAEEHQSGAAGAAIAEIALARMRRRFSQTG